MRHQLYNLVKSFIKYLLLFAMLLIGCTTATSEEVIIERPTTTKATVITQQSLNTPTAMPSAIPIATVTATHTATPMPLATANLLNTFSQEELANWLEVQWKQEVPFNTVQNILASTSWIERYLWPDDNWQIPPLRHTALDITGDGRAEWFFSIHIDEKETFCAPYGALWVINQDGLIFTLEYNGNYDWSAPIPMLSGDITGDGLPEIMTNSIICGGSTPTIITHVLSAHKGDIRNIILRSHPLDEAVQPFRIESNSMFTPEWGTDGIQFWNSYLPHPAEQQLISWTTNIEDWTGDGLLDLVMRGGTYNSNAGAWARERTEVWSWNGEGLVLDSFAFAHSDAIAMKLIDARLAEAIGDRETAVALYQTIFQETTIIGEEHPFPDYIAIVDSTLRPFAGFKLLLYALAQEEMLEAQAIQTQLIDQYPEAPFTIATQQLLADVSIESCQTAVEQAIQTILTLAQEQTGYPPPLFYYQGAPPIIEDPNIECIPLETSP